MAWYTNGLNEVMLGNIDLINDTIKLMLVKSTHTPDKSHVNISEISADECDCTGYTGGFAGAGRKTVTMDNTANQTDDRADFGAADVSMGALGGAANNTIGYVMLVKEVTNDGDSLLIAYSDPANLLTDGSTVTIDFTAAASGGNLRASA